MVTKIVFTTERPTFLDEYDLEVLETFDLGERQAAKIEIPADADADEIVRVVERDERVEGVEDSFDAELI